MVNKEHPENIHPIFDRQLAREDKEALLKQRGMVLWMTGLSGSGKSTIAIGLEKKLFGEGFVTQVLDGDNIRTGLNKDLKFSETDRLENTRRIAEVAKLFANCGIITICSFVSPTDDIREQVRSIIGKKDFFEIYVNASFEVCETRDVKGLYKKARQGEIKHFTGLDAPFEAPENPALEIKTDELDVNESIEKLHRFVKGIVLN